MKNRTKIVNSIYNLKFKIIALIFFCITISIVSNSIILVSSASHYLASSVENDLLSLALSYGITLENNINSNNNNLNIENVSHYLENIDIKGTQSSYAYLVSVADGNMVYHPEAEKIGQPVANETIKQVATDLRNGKNINSSIASYIYKGKPKYSAYYISQDKNYILVITVDQAEILSPKKILIRKAVITLIIILFSMVLLGYFIAASISNPIKKLTNIILQLSELNFVVDSSHNELLNKKGEVGMISSAIFNMHNNLCSIIADIEHMSIDLNSSADELNAVCNTLNSNSLENCALSQQLSANMQETSATTEMITSNINIIAEKAENITILASNGEKHANKILERATQLKAKAENEAKNSKELYSSITEKASSALENFSIINDISELTTTIKSIADQTSLLSLNASIEAARAGENGKGFAVVAEEIGNLASQSILATDNITSLITQIQSASSNMSQCVKMLLDFINKISSENYAELSNISQLYNTDADTSKNNMHTINSSIEELKQSLSQISTSINQINFTITDCTNGISNVSQNASDMVALTSKTDTISKNTGTHSQSLKNIINKFKL